MGLVNGEEIEQLIKTEQPEQPEGTESNEGKQVVALTAAES